MSTPASEIGRGSRRWTALVVVATVLGVFVAVQVVWAAATGSIGAAVLVAPGLVFWFWIGAGALRRRRTTSSA